MTALAPLGGTRPLHSRVVRTAAVAVAVLALAAVAQSNWETPIPLDEEAREARGCVNGHMMDDGAQWLLTYNKNVEDKVLVASVEFTKLKNNAANHTMFELMLFEGYEDLYDATGTSISSALGVPSAGLPTEPGQKVTLASAVYITGTSARMFVGTQDEWEEVEEDFATTGGVTVDLSGTADNPVLVVRGPGPEGAAAYSFDGVSLYDGFDTRSFGGLQWDFSGTAEGWWDTQAQKPEGMNSCYTATPSGPWEWWAWMLLAIGILACLLVVLLVAGIVYSARQPSAQAYVVAPPGAAAQQGYAGAAAPFAAAPAASAPSGRKTSGGSKGSKGSKGSRGGRRSGGKGGRSGGKRGGGGGGGKF